MPAAMRHDLGDRSKQRNSDAVHEESLVHSLARSNHCCSGIPQDFMLGKSIFESMRREKQPQRQMEESPSQLCGAAKIVRGR